MKTNNNYIVPTVAISAIALLAATKIEINYLPDAPVVISYLAVGALFVLAALDNRRGSKNYLAR
jgi:hypothetical protein